ncbi:MAG: c-type cytochrome [Solirubrobacterales bacterium]
MKRIWLYGAVALVIGGAAAFLAWNRHGDGIAPSDARQVALGHSLYDRHCASCHGADLKGEPDWQVRKPNGELPAPPHDASGHTWHHSDEQLFAITKQGIGPFAPPGYRSAMQGYGDKLSDAEIRAILAYIKSTWPEQIRKRQQAIRQP